MWIPLLHNITEKMDVGGYSNSSDDEHYMNTSSIKQQEKRKCYNKYRPCNCS